MHVRRSCITKLIVSEGVVAEWFKAAVLKTAELEKVP